MLDKLFFTFNAILPIIIVVSVGYFLKRIKLFPKEFFNFLNKLSFRCCIPILLFINVYNVNNIKQIAGYGKVCAYAVLSILCCFLAGIVIAMLFIKNPLQKGVIVQAAYRSNYAIIGIPLAISLCNNSPEPVAIASILSSITIPLFNILATIALTVFVQQGENRLSFSKRVVAILKKIITNPLIIGVLSGFVFLIIRSLLPVNENGQCVFTIKKNLPFLYNSVNMIAQATSAVALIALGGNFEFSAVAKLKKQIILGTFMRCILCPVVCLTVAYLIGFRQLEFPALIALYGSPIAVSSAPMAVEMKNDGELASQIVVWTSVASGATLFIIIFVCAQLGIFAIS